MPEYEIGRKKALSGSFFELGVLASSASARKHIGFSETAARDHIGTGRKPARNRVGIPQNGIMGNKLLDLEGRAMPL